MARGKSGTQVYRRGLRALGLEVCLVALSWGWQRPLVVRWCIQITNMFDFYYVYVNYSIG